MAVSKTLAPEHIREAYQAGLRVFGENRVQEFSSKAGALTNLKDAGWHMIGHLQTNKAAKAVELFTAVDSVDSLRLAEKLNRSAQQMGKRLVALIEINVGGEAAKSGMLPESPELDELLKAAPRLLQSRRGPRLLPGGRGSGEPPGAPPPHPGSPPPPADRAPESAAGRRLQDLLSHPVATLPRGGAHRRADGLHPRGRPRRAPDRACRGGIGGARTPGAPNRGGAA